MFEAGSVTRLFRITKNIGVVATGLIADARYLVSRIRQEASNYSYKHSHEIPVDLLARRIANLNQLLTQEAGMRPMGVELMLIAIDEERGGPQVFKCDPAGFYTGYVATASGPKSVDLQNALEKRIGTRESDGRRVIGATVAETIELAVMTLGTVLSQEFKPADLEVGIVTTETPAFRVLSEDEIEAVLTRIAERD